MEKLYEVSRKSEVVVAFLRYLLTNQTSSRPCVFLLSLPVYLFLIDVEGIPAPGSSMLPHADLLQGVEAISTPSCSKPEMSTKLSLMK